MTNDLMHGQWLGVGILEELGWYLVQTKMFSFYQTKNCFQQSCFAFFLSFFFFFFFEASYWTFLVNFLKLSFGEIIFWTMTQIWLLLVPLRAAFLAEMRAM